LKRHFVKMSKRSYRQIQTDSSSEETDPSVCPTIQPYADDTEYSDAETDDTLDSFDSDHLIVISDESEEEIDE